MAARHHNRLRALLIGDAPAPALLALVWRAGAGPALKALFALCRQAFADDPLVTPSRP